MRVVEPEQRPADRPRCATGSRHGRPDGAACDPLDAVVRPRRAPLRTSGPSQGGCSRRDTLSDIRKRITLLGGGPVADTPEQFAAIIHGDIVKWKKVAAAAH